jgi:hypothetical protein
MSTRKLKFKYSGMVLDGNDGFKRALPRRHLHFFPSLAKKKERKFSLY